MDKNTFEKTINFTRISYTRVEQLQPINDYFMVARKISKKEAVKTLKEAGIYPRMIPGSLRIEYTKHVYRMSIEYFTEVAERVG